MSTTWIDSYLAKFGTNTNDARTLHYLADQLEHAVNYSEMYMRNYGEALDKSEWMELVSERDAYKAALTSVRSKLSK